MANNKICVACRKKDLFTLTTEDYRPIITENNQYYVSVLRNFNKLYKINPLRPIWTNPYGNAVTQYDMVLLGGDGLNS
jgi:hypothetical protein